MTLPNSQERDEMERIHTDLMQNFLMQEARDYFANLIRKYQQCGVVILGCTEYPLIVSSENSALPIIDPVDLQVSAAVTYGLRREPTP